MGYFSSVTIMPTPESCSKHCVFCLFVHILGPSLGYICGDKRAEGLNVMHPENVDSYFVVQVDSANLFYHKPQWRRPSSPVPLQCRIYLKNFFLLMYRIKSDISLSFQFRVNYTSIVKIHFPQWWPASKTAREAPGLPRMFVSHSESGLACVPDRAQQERCVWLPGPGTTCAWTSCFRGSQLLYHEDSLSRDPCTKNQLGNTSPPAVWMSHFQSGFSNSVKSSDDCGPSWHCLQSQEKPYARSTWLSHSWISVFRKSER